MPAVRLRELEARFIRSNPPVGWQTVDTIDEADGVMFLCPGCFARNGGAEGTHVVICWEPSVPLDVSPGPGRWPLVGTSLDDLTLTPSVALDCWHGWVKNGDAS